MDVPANATNINFGALNTGSGTAWFDSLAIEINGVPYTENNTVDLDFESSTPRGFYTAGQGYEIALDNTVAQSGKQSLRMKRITPPQTAASEKDSAASLIQKCNEVVKYLKANRSVYLKAGSTSQQIDWVIQNARLVLQYAQLKSGTKSRDESMAENIQWIADQNPGAKLIVWAHNGHISNSGYSGTASMGSYLRKTYGDQLVNFGFAFNEGSFRAWEIGIGLHDFTVGPGPEGSLDRTLGAVKIPIFAVDLRQLPMEGPVAQWFKQPHASRSVGSAYSDTLAPNLWSPGPSNLDFDALLFVENTTAARPNP
jgi:erythromycin esterase-like protein